MSNLQAETLPYKVTIAAVFQNEAPYLKEWIEFHRIVGVEFFRLYNNHSKDHFETVLAPYIEQGIIELIDWPMPSHDTPTYLAMQLAAYNDAIEKSIPETEWLALIDIDEFLFPVKDDSLYICLSNKFQHASAVGVNWQKFGTSKVKKIPPHKTLIETLTKKARIDHYENTNIKSIIRPADVEICNNPHACILKPGKILLNGAGQGRASTHFDENDRGVYIDELCINHYWTRDLDFYYKVKLPRYLVWFPQSEKQAKSRFKRMDGDLNRFKDTRILKYLPELKKRLKKSPL